MDAPTGGRVHRDHPFLLPEAEREPLRRARGRLTAGVTLWTAEAAGERAGLTVSSVVVAEPGALAGLVGEDSDLLAAVEESGRFVVHVLDWRHRRLADAFAFVAPAPGGVFAAAEFAPSAWGPVLADATTWLGCRLTGSRPLGWSRLVEAEVEHVALTDEQEPLVWQRGRYRHLG